MKRDSTSNLTLAVLVRDALCQSFLSKVQGTSARDAARFDLPRTLERTAIEAYEFPKLMPTTDGKELTLIGASAVPLGSGVEDFDLAMLAMGGEQEEGRKI